MRLEIPEDLSPEQRAQLADDVIEYIVDRTKKGYDWRGRKFPGYSPDYIKSLDFKIAGKSRSRIDLTLSGEMLADLKLISHKPGSLLIGFEAGSESNAKAEGNILGSYGGSPKRSRARDFLGITDRDFQRILEPYEMEGAGESEE